MPATITATEAKNRFGEVIRRVCKGGETLIVERGGLPVMAIVPMQEYQASGMRKQARFARAVRAAAQEAETLGLTEDQVERETREIRQDVYRERYGE
ncbi:MAG: type II toxin-antitoxin system Phd/YefM family antitoxin [Anaerolineae bacterium]